MAYLKIHCDYCGGAWEVYRRDRDDDKARKCPHCLSKIDRSTWEKTVLPAFEAVEDANRELYRDHIEHYPLFTFDVMADHIFTGDPRGCANID